MSISRIRRHSDSLAMTRFGRPGRWRGPARGPGGWPQPGTRRIRWSPRGIWTPSSGPGRPNCRVSTETGQLQVSSDGSLLNYGATSWAPSPRLPRATRGDGLPDKRRGASRFGPMGTTAAPSKGNLATAVKATRVSGWLLLLAVTYVALVLGWFYATTASMIHLFAFLAH